MKKSLLFGLILFVASVGLAFADGFKATSKPVALPAGTNGSYGTKGTYVLFGDWPQSVKADNVTVSSNKEDVNGWDAYKGSDGCYYVKAEAVTNDDSYKFNNGKPIVDWEEYYFKLEPIKWRVVTNNYQGGKLLVAENVLAASRYDSLGNNYKDSTIRSWLNNDFLNGAFTKETIENINTTTVDNSGESSGFSSNSYACENTEDKIFLLSRGELLESSYGFDSDELKKDTARRRKTTDYSRATGAYSDTGENFKNNGRWWMRSPDFSFDEFVFGVSADGNALLYGRVYNSDRGVVPALTMNF